MARAPWRYSWHATRPSPRSVPLLLHELEIQSPLRHVLSAMRRGIWRRSSKLEDDTARELVDVRPARAPAAVLRLDLSSLGPRDCPAHGELRWCINAKMMHSQLARLAKQVMGRVRRRTSRNARLIALIVTITAAYGVLANSTAVIIRAMLVAPFMGRIHRDPSGKPLLACLRARPLQQGRGKMSRESGFPDGRRSKRFDE